MREENPQDLSWPRGSIYLKLNHLIFVINFLSLQQFLVMNFLPKIVYILMKTSIRTNLFSLLCGFQTNFSPAPTLACLRSLMPTSKGKRRENSGEGQKKRRRRKKNIKGKQFSRFSFELNWHFSLSSLL